ncbi:MAG: hypothetical protein KDD15_21495, partial [Lewinella sp.]|nr:hypothetical protein [Lewinella sp.]
LDPFSGTGTTVLEAKLNGLTGIGVEANPAVFFASNVKLKWDIDPVAFEKDAVSIADETNKKLKIQGIDDNLTSLDEVDLLKLKDITPEKKKLLLRNSVSPLPFHKALTLLEFIKKSKSIYQDHLLLAFITSLVKDVSNLRFGPEIGVGKIKDNAPVINPWLEMIRAMSHDIGVNLPSKIGSGTIKLGDAREIHKVIKRESVDAVITSPPYPNEKDYSRTTRLENVILGLVKDKMHLRSIKKTFVRSNTRGIYKEDNDDKWIQDNATINLIAEKIEARRIALNKTSGFERLYGRVTKQYFGGMARHLENMKFVLKPGAQLAYVVGDQASYLRILIRTGQILSEIAKNQGYEVMGVDLFRTRFATKTKEELREEVVLLKYKGK